MDFNLFFELQKWIKSDRNRIDCVPQGINNTIYHITSAHDQVDNQYSNAMLGYRGFPGRYTASSANVSSSSFKDMGLPIKIGTYPKTIRIQPTSGETLALDALECTRCSSLGRKSLIFDKCCILEINTRLLSYYFPIYQYNVIIVHDNAKINYNSLFICLVVAFKTRSGF